jgi:hypothetical protein
MNGKRWVLALMIVGVIVLAGCGPQAAEPTQSADTGTTKAARGAERGLDRASVLALGTLRLENTGNAVTSAQAAGLLPLWKVVEGGSLQGGAETEAVVKQIEDVMTAPQRAAIGAMELAFEDMQAWMQEQGIEMPVNAGGQGAPAGFQEMSEEERAKMREQFQNMTDKERATRMAEMGIQSPEGGKGARPGGGDQGTSSHLFGALVELLNARATG